MNETPAHRLTPAQRHKLRHEQMKAEATAAGAAPSAPKAPEPTPGQKLAADRSARPALVGDSQPKSRPLSPAQRHRAIHAVRAATESAGKPATGAPAPDRDETGPGASDYDLLRARLGNDLREIGDQPSIERKIELKVRKLPAYADHIAAVLHAAQDTGKAVQDEVFVQLMIWAIDAGVWALALPMAEHVLKFGLSLPERFERAPAVVILEQVAEAGLKAAKLDQPFPVDVLQKVEALTADYPINDIVRAKLQKALGLHLVAAADALDQDADGPAGAQRAMKAQALSHFRRALELHDKAGVVKSIEDLERQLKRFEPGPDATT